MDLSLKVVEETPPVSVAGLQQSLEEICRIGPRWHGTASEERSIRLIEQRLAQYCDEVKLEEFPYVHYTALAAELEITKPSQRPVGCVAVQYSQNGSAAGEVVYVGEGHQLDYAALAESGLQVKGCLVLARTNRPYATGKIALQYGAVGLIIISDSPFGSIRQMTSQLGYEQPDDLNSFGIGIPGVIVSREDGEAILSMLSTGELQAKIRHESTVEIRTSSNVVGFRWGREEADKQVVIGAHYDTQFGIEGAWDNASGCAALLEIARSCAGVKPRRTMVFCGFGGEEIGLFGSTSFVKSRVKQLDTILCYVNLDSTSGDVPYTHELLTTQPMSDLAVTLINDHSNWKITHSRAFTALDHEQDSAEFVKHGINAFWAHEEGNAFFHTVYDTIATISPQKLARATRVALLPFYYLARMDVPPI